LQDRVILNGNRTVVFTDQYSVSMKPPVSLVEPS
jgi:hypothetical protein